MLEHILIRYENSVEIFRESNSSRWKYIVLDEVHTYGGATGIEVSMLLKRVLATINNDAVRFILTSATLGSDDSNEEVAKFASKLTSLQFEKSDVIRADRILRSKPLGCKDHPFSLYEEIWDRIRNGYSTTTSDTDSVLHDNLFWKVYDALSDKEVCSDIEDIANVSGLSKSEVEIFIDVVNRLKDDRGYKLVDSKYHTFVRAIDGVQFSLGPSFKVSLSKTKSIMDSSYGREFAAFNMAVCYNCNAVFIPGKIKSGLLFNANDIDEDDKGNTNSELYYVCKPEEYDSDHPELFFQVCAGCRAFSA
jgi:hypothetical protein